MSKILVAEDELAINKMICMNLNITGYETVSMQDGKEVLDYLAAGQSADLAIVDIMMPKVDGFALLEPLNKAGIPVIYLTALGDIESKVRGLSGGAEDYMVKPFEMLELLLRIEKILKRTGKSDELIKLDDVILDMKKRTVSKKDEQISLTPMQIQSMFSKMVTGCSTTIQDLMQGKSLNLMRQKKAIIKLSMISKAASYIRAKTITVSAAKI